MSGPRLDLDRLEEARFPSKDEFEHFDNPEHPTCFACNSRMMLVRPSAVTDDFVLLPATTRLGDGRFVVMPGCWLVYPRVHATTLFELPDDWTASVKQAIRSLGLEQPFCTSENWGKAAGQTVEHAHTWVIARGNESGLLTENTGLATILQRVMVHGIQMP